MKIIESLDDFRYVIHRYFWPLKRTSLQAHFFKHSSKFFNY